MLTLNTDPPGGPNGTFHSCYGSAIPPFHATKVDEYLNYGLSNAMVELANALQTHSVAEGDSERWFGTKAFAFKKNVNAILTRRQEMLDAQSRLRKLKRTEERVTRAT